MMSHPSWREQMERRAFIRGALAGGGVVSWLWCVGMAVYQWI